MKPTAVSAFLTHPQINPHPEIRPRLRPPVPGPWQSVSYSAAFNKRPPLDMCQSVPISWCIPGL
jgi:hypothetical protein